MKNVSYSKLVITLSLLILFIICGFNYFVDPFTYYHRPWTSLNFSQNHRYSNPGLARQFDYQTVLIGTSHVMELGSDRLSELMGEPGLNLSISAGVIREQSQLVELILRQNKATSVLWEMNYPSFSYGDGFNDSDQEYPQYFYTPTLETPFRYLMSYDTVVESWAALEDPGRITIDNRNVEPRREFSRSRVLANWDYQTDRWNDDLRKYWSEFQLKVESPALLLERRVIPLLKQNPQVTFKLILPPNSVLFFMLLDSMGANDFDELLTFRDKLGMLSKDFQNVEIYDFQVNWSMIDNLERFRDIEHFNQEVLEEVFHSISRRDGRVDLPRLLKNTDLLRQHVRSYEAGFCSVQPERCSDLLKSRVGLPMDSGRFGGM